MSVANLGAVTGLPSDLERLRVLVDGVKDFAIFMLDTDGRVATWSLGAERLKGYRAEEVLGADLSRFHVPEDIVAGKPRHALNLSLGYGFAKPEPKIARRTGLGRRVCVSVLGPTIPMARGPCPPPGRASLAERHLSS